MALRHNDPVPSIDLVDESYLVADHQHVTDLFHDPALWRLWWPDLHLTVRMDRGLKGLRWAVSGRAVGSSEVWLEPAGDGVILHYFLRAEPTRPGSDTEPLRGWFWWRRRVARSVGRRHSAAFKHHSWALKDSLERGRAPGMPRVTVGTLTRASSSAETAEGAHPDGGSGE